MYRPVQSKTHSHRRPFVESLEPRQLLANVATGFTDSTYVSGLLRPTAMAFAPDGRLFVSEQDGKVRIVKNGQLLGTSALSLTVSKAGERGVLGSAFDPDFANNSWFYLYYTAGGPAHNRLSRFKVVGDTIDKTSEDILLDLEPLTAAYHNGGALHFGEDGKLYVSVGENTRTSLAQSKDSLLGKILRINPDGSIPTDNPFYNTATGQNRLIYDLGFRNPFTFAIEPGTNRLFINDVGESQWEEVNRDDGDGGMNFGWPQFTGPTNGSGFTAPFYFYEQDPGCAVVGADFYPSSGGSFPSAYKGMYFFGDHCDGTITALNPSTGAIIGEVSKGGITALADIDIGPDGALYYLERTFDGPSGRIGRIQFNNAGTTAPSITVQPKNVKVGAGSKATFDVGVTGTPPFEYQWQKNSNNIAGATGPSYTIASTGPGDAGNYRVVIKNSKGTVTSAAATLTVTVNEAPTITLGLPAADLTYRAGDTIPYSATATDPQEGSLGGSAFTWQVDFHHDTHLHPFVSPVTGSKTGSFTIPRIGETSSNTWYAITLTVTDSDGNSSSVRREIFPKKSKVTLQTNIAGPNLSLDGTSQAAPISFKGVEKFFRDVEASPTQVLAGKTYVFQGWSDGGSAKHTISTPTADTVFTANYVLQGASGTGVIADYYNNADFTGTHIQTIEPVINNAWEDGSPDPNISRDTFSARWSGLVKADEDATYTFYTKVDDGVRLFVGNQQIISKWEITNQENEYSGTITLKKGKSYELRMDFREATGNATAQLRWSTPSTAKTLVPQASLYPVAPTTPPSIGGTISASGDAFVQNGSSANTSFGTQNALQVKQSIVDGLLRLSYLKFNLKNFSAIESAKLRLYGAVKDASATNITTQVFGSNDSDWDETTMTFNTAPATSGGAIDSAVIVNNTPKYYEWDVSAYIKAQKAAGRNVVTLVLKNPDITNPFVFFNSREAGANRPQLVIG